jgi:O-methyltransferase
MSRPLIDPAKRVLSALGISVRHSFTKFVGEIPHSTVNALASYSPWLADAAFQRTWETIRHNTLVDIYRCYELWHLAGQVGHLQGEVIEVGVWRGGTGCLVAKRLQSDHIPARVFLCDTFEGVVKAGERDPTYRGGEHADTSTAVVQSLVASLGLDNVTISKGIFPDQTGSVVAGASFRFAHVDVDTFESAKGVVDFIWPRLVPQGLLVFDDYGFIECEGITRYVNEHMLRPDRVMIQNLNGHAVVVKLA